MMTDYELMVLPKQGLIDELCTAARSIEGSSFEARAALDYMERIWREMDRRHHLARFRQEGIGFQVRAGGCGVNQKGDSK